MVKFAKAIGANTDLLTAQAFIFSRVTDINDPSGSKTTVAVIISAQGDDVFTQVRVVTLSLEEQFFDNSTSISDKLISSLNYLKDELKNFQELQILLACWKEDLIYLLVSGEHKAYIKREDQPVSDLTSQAPQNQIISGFIKPNDKILLINSRLDDQIDSPLSWDNQIIETLLETSLENLEVEVEQTLQQMSLPEPIAAILINKLPEQQIKLESSEVVSPTLAQQPVQLNLSSFKLNLKSLFNLIKIFENLPLKTKTIFFILLLPITLIILIIALKLLPASKIKSQSNIQASNQPSPTTDLKITQIQNWTTYLSLDLIKNDFSTNKLSLSLGNLLLMDQNQKTLVTINLSNKNQQILAGITQLGNATSSTINGDNIFVFSKDKGVVKINLQTKKIDYIAKVDEEWGNIVDIYGFGGNVYLLDNLKNSIWKYLPVSTGYSNKFNYLNSKLDLAGASRLQIDYSVWVLESTPEVIKLTAGDKDFFSISGLNTPIKTIKSFYVAEKQDKIYLLDSENQRLVILNKKGEYQSQFISDKFKTATDLVVNTDPDSLNNTLYLLEGRRIYQVELGK